MRGGGFPPPHPPPRSPVLFLHWHILWMSIIRQATSSISRVQEAVFVLLYPVFVRLPAPVGYRRPLSSSCTRFSSDSPLRSGTDHTFPPPVPGFRPISRLDRVQEALFVLLYPVFVQFPAQIRYRSHFSASCTRRAKKIKFLSESDKKY